jgi:hypothetical protein
MEIMLDDKPDNLPTSEVISIAPSHIIARVTFASLMGDVPQ